MLMKTPESFRNKASIASLALVAVLSASVEPAHAADAWLEGGAQSEPASVAAPVGNNCILHPEGNKDPQHAIIVKTDADGGARFLADRTTMPSSDKRLARDCVDANGGAQAYTVGLRSEETFAPRAFATCGSQPASRRLGQSCAHSWAHSHALLEPCP
jgi:hypothetical protein